MTLTTSLYAAVLASFYIILSINVVRGRRRHSVALGDNNIDDMKPRIALMVILRNTLLCLSCYWRRPNTKAWRAGLFRLVLGIIFFLRPAITCLWASCL